MNTLVVKSVQADRLAVIKVTKSNKISGIIHGNTAELSHLVSRIKRSWSQYSKKTFKGKSFTQVSNTRTLTSSQKNFSAKLVIGESGDPLVAIEQKSHKVICFPLNSLLKAPVVAF